MKIVLIASAIAVSLMAPQAFAQASNFQGFSLGANLNAANFANEFNANGQTFKNGDKSANGGVQAAYGFGINDSFVMGLGVTYALGDLRAGSASSGGVGYELKAKNLYSVYLEPGFVISNSTMAYAKVSYQHTKGEMSLSTGDTQSEDYSGVGYGAGIRTVLDKNVYLQVEFSQLLFNEKTTGGLISKPSATIGTIGFGYKF